jgi:hypothetical protein
LITDKAVPFAKMGFLCIYTEGMNMNSFACLFAVSEEPVSSFQMELETPAHGSRHPQRSLA